MTQPHEQHNPSYQSAGLGYGPNHRDYFTYTRGAEHRGIGDPPSSRSSPDANSQTRAVKIHKSSLLPKHDTTIL